MSLLGLLELDLVDFGAFRSLLLQHALNIEVLAARRFNKCSGRGD